MSSKSRALEDFSTSLLNSFTMCLRRCWSKSSPPRKVSPLVDFTSNTPFWISRTEISNVPPPRSYTAILQTSQLVSKKILSLQNSGLRHVLQCFSSKCYQLTFYPGFCPDRKPEQQLWVHWSHEGRSNQQSDQHLWLPEIPQTQIDTFKSFNISNKLFKNTNQNE